ncbi:MAG: class I SAM-dependent methyltransferase [Anaerolineae bacterium]|nr:class I SAM-dependent methyltransferase [Anaerolineae bacterium]
MFNQQMQSAYDQIAPHFARVNATMPESVGTAADQFLHMLPPGAHVLDVGCGHGRDIMWFEVRGCAVTGADLSYGMLAQARQIVQSPLVQMDMRNLPFCPAAFDGVWCNAALLHLPKCDVPRALAEFRRLLKPEGVLFISLQGGEGEGWEPLSYEHNAPRFFARYVPEEVMAMLAQCGFTIVAQSSSYQSPTRYWLHFFAMKGNLKM